MIHPPRPSLPRATATALRLGLLCAASTCSTPLEDDPASVPFDVADGGTPGWQVRVLVGPRFPLTPGAGFAVRAENAAGQVFERTAGADGVVPLGVAREDGPWDLTVARAGCRAVSILGVAGDFDGDVYSECAAAPPPPRETAHTLFVRVEGFPDLSTDLDVCLPGSTSSGTPDRIRVDFADRPGTSPGDVWVVRFESGARDARPRNIARLAVPSLHGRNTTVTVSLPTPPVPVVRSRVAVQFPTEGLLTGESAERSSGYGPVYRQVRFYGEATSCHVGAGLWTPPDASGRGTFAFETFGPPFEPDSAGILLGFNGGNVAVQGGVRVRRVTDGDVVQVPPVWVLRAEADPPANVRFRVDAPDYGIASFQAVPTGPNIHGEWVGYMAHGATLDGRRLPQLPTTVSLRDLTFGMAQDNHFAVRACIATTRPGARPPWTPAGLDADVSLCAATTAALSREPM